MKYFSIICILAFITFSCQKESTSNQRTTTDSERLKKFIIFDLANAAPDDTSVVIEYIYDNMGRCMLRKETSYPTSDSTFIHNFYNGTDTLISSQTIIRPGIDTIKEFFTYNSAGEMTSDSVVYPNGGPILTYTYQVSADYVYANINLYSSPLWLSKYHLQKNNVGNIIVEKDSSFENSIFRAFTKIEKSFDSNPCPFYNLYPKRLVSMDYFNFNYRFPPLFSSICQKNNITTEVRTSNSSFTIGPYNHSFSYTYNANNYPNEVILTDMINGSRFKGIYIY